MMTEMTRRLASIALGLILLAACGSGATVQSGDPGGGPIVVADNTLAATESAATESAASDPSALSDRTTTVVEDVDEGLAQILPEFAFGYSEQDLQTIGSAAQAIVARCTTATGGVGPYAPLIDLDQIHGQRNALLKAIRFDDPTFVQTRGYTSPFSAGATESTELTYQPVPASCWAELYETFASAGAGYLRNDVNEIARTWHSALADAPTDPALAAQVAAWRDCMTSKSYEGAEIGKPLPDSTDPATQALADSACRSQSGYTDQLLNLMANDVTDFEAAHDGEIEAAKAGRDAELEISVEVLAQG
jgi:hypothetical protein